jgi:hypothetical protein
MDMNPLHGLFLVGSQERTNRRQDLLRDAWNAKAALAFLSLASLCVGALAKELPALAEGIPSAC